MDHARFRLEMVPLRIILHYSTFQKITSIADWKLQEVYWLTLKKTWSFLETFKQSDKHNHFHVLIWMTYHPRFFSQIPPSSVQSHYSTHRRLYFCLLKIITVSYSFFQCITVRKLSHMIKCWSHVWLYMITELSYT